ncbi:MAG: YqaJ viral recombinase family protein [Malacoplasma sp.]
MPFKATYKNDFYISNDKIFLSEEYKNKNRNKFKKITGSRFSAILMQSKYSSPFKTWAIMTNIYYEKMDETLSKVGNAIEPKIRNYISKIMDVKFLSYVPEKEKWDVFKKNEIFGGIPDGEPVNDNSDFLYKDGMPMLEVKTTSIDSFVYKYENDVLTLMKDKNNLPIVKEQYGKLLSWFENDKMEISYDYQLQLALYLYLRKHNLGLFAIAFLDKKYYLDYSSYKPENNYVATSFLYINKDEFQKLISYSENWYEKHIVEGVSPTATKEDLIWLKKELKI